MLSFETSADVRALADFLASIPIGEAATYDALAATISRDILAHRHLLYSAIKVVQREHNALFVTVRGVGCKRISAGTASEVVGIHARSRIRSTSRRGLRAINAAIRSSNSESPEVQRRLSAEANALGLIEVIARDNNVKPAATADSKPMPVAEAAKQFLARIGAI